MSDRSVLPAPILPALHALLDAIQLHDLSGRDTSLHSPMALTALAGMGAGPERLAGFYRDWTRRHALPLVPPAGCIDWPDWPSCAGQRAAYPALRQCFLLQMAVDGVVPVVAAVMTRLPFSPATQAFHAVIRLAHALESGHAGETAAGLAAYVACHVDPGIALAGRPRTAAYRDGLALLSQAFGGEVHDKGWITERFARIARDPRFDAHFRAPPSGAWGLESLRVLALELYLLDGSFAALHGVTGLHAVRVLHARIPGLDAAFILPGLWLAFCLLHVSLGAPLLTGTRPGSVAAPDWPALFAEAIGRDDDHDIKLVWSCYREWLHAPDAGYPQAASMRLGLSAEAMPA